MQKQDYYKTLGVPKAASADQIKSAYRKMALKYHPDRNPDNKQAEDKFKEASEAYEVLSDAQKRKTYDQFGHAGMNQGAGGFNAGSMNMDDIFEQFGDIFGDLFGGGRRQRRRPAGPQAQRGHDLYKEIVISLKDSYLGKKEEITYYHFFTCETCSGKGAKAGTNHQMCGECQGSGQKSFQQGFFMYSQPCGGCAGQGYTMPFPCEKCHGKSRIQNYDKFTVTIPAGVFDEAELRIGGKGDAGVYGGPAGDLYLKIMVMPDKQFERQGDDLICNVLLTYPQLVLGAQVEIESIDGTKEMIKIPKGCPVEEKIVAPGKGFKKLRSNTRGNLVVITQCHVPKKLNPDAKKKLKDYSDVIGTDTKNSDGYLASLFKKFLG